MPNHVENNLTFDGNEKDIKELMNCLIINGEPSVDGFLPMPSELRDTTSPSRVENQVLINKYGHDNWYDWAVENWGTKWGFYGGIVTSDNSVYFQTAWATQNAPPIFAESARQIPWQFAPAFYGTHPAPPLTS